MSTSGLAITSFERHHKIRMCCIRDSTSHVLSLHSHHHTSSPHVTCLHYPTNHRFSCGIPLTLCTSKFTSGFWLDVCILKKASWLFSYLAQGAYPFIDGLWNPQSSTGTVLSTHYYCTWYCSLVQYHKKSQSSICMRSTHIRCTAPTRPLDAVVAVAIFCRHEIWFPLKWPMHNQKHTVLRANRGFGYRYFDLCHNPIALDFRPPLSTLRWGCDQYNTIA